jgi:ubiquinone/menaquinone biosynthesis C-methylase UbiE
VSQPDVWAAGDAYEAYVGRWSRLVAREFVRWLGVDPNRDWLDVGCGTGMLSRTIIDLASAHSVTGIDPSEAFIAYAERNTPDGASFRVGDAQSLPFRDDALDVAVSGLVLNFVPDPRRAVGDMKRCVRVDGVVAAYVWDYAERMEMMRYFWDAVAMVDPEAAKHDEARRFTICSPDSLRELFSDAGLTKIDVTGIEVPTPFADLDDLWLPLLGGQGPAGAYVVALSDDRRDDLHDQLRSVLPMADDGSIALVARAWAVKGVVTA